MSAFDTEPVTPLEPVAPPAGAEAILVCDGVRKSFPLGKRELEVLHGVGLELYSGEVLGLMGSSGAGKSTLLHILGLLDRPNEGRVVIDGVDAWSLPTVERAALRNHEIGFVFQFYHLLPDLNSLENTLLPAMIGNSFFSYLGQRGELRDRAMGLLESMGMGDRIKHRPRQLSGGERQRVAIARALLFDPPILIADEPTGNLDSATGERVLELLFEQRAARGSSLLLVTHDERLAKRCGRVLYMADGLIQGDTETPIPH